MPRAAPRAPRIPAPAPLPCPPDWPTTAANMPPPSMTARPIKMQATPPRNSRIAMTVTPPGLFIRLLLCYCCRVLYPYLVRLYRLIFRDVDESKVLYLELARKEDKRIETQERGAGLLGPAVRFA